MQRLSNPKPAGAVAQQPSAPVFEKTSQFQQAQAIVWQIKFIVNQINSKKMMTQAANELENLSEQFGKEFDKYLLKELIEQIDLKDPVKAQKDKNEPHKVSLLNQELSRCSQKPEFLLYFNEIAQQSFSDRPNDFLNELTKRLRLSFPNQLLVALSLAESSREESQTEVMKILKQKLVDYHNYGKPEPLPEYAVHRILYLIGTHPELVSFNLELTICQNQDENLRDVAQYIIDSNPLKQNSHISLRPVLQQDLMYANCSQEEPSVNIMKEGNGLDNLDKTYKMLEPWQILNDLGHYCTYNYNFLLKTLEEFKDISEKTMARTLLQLSVNHSGTDDHYSRLVTVTLEANKKGDSSALKKEIGEKKTPVTWSVDNLARAFRELYSHLSWQKVFEALSDIEDDITLDAKAFGTFLQIFNKSKPQNFSYPLNLILSQEWQNPSLQINFIENSIHYYVEKKDKLIQFNKTERRQEILDDIAGVKDKVAAELLHVWCSVDLVERLILLSDTHYFQRVRVIFESPMKTVPEYLLLTISQIQNPTRGSLLIDELLSLLLPQFLGNHINSIPVLQALWRNNQALMIRGVCELCRHDQRIMNLSRVLDITQEVKESLIPIVNCEDYYFAVNLGILAGKRDFLHYDVWLNGRIQEVGTPFIKALLKYIKEHIIVPIMEYQKKHTNANTGNLDVTADQLEHQKQQILERSHLSKEKLCITIEHLSNPINSTNPRIKHETQDQIRDVVTKLGEFFPSQFSQAQNSEEIDNAANDYFQRVFSAEPSQVDQKITELIETMQRFKESDVKKEQEIYACMLHSLFDEYRFLHRYPQQYLEKIAKLFGAIIKHRIIDGTLQDIALKFAFEAFRREGKRQKFGVITIKQFFDMLPEFPQFFEDIYEIRSTIHQTDHHMIKDIEDLYERTMKKPKDEDKKEDSSTVQQQTPSVPQQTTGQGAKKGAPAPLAHDERETGKNKKQDKNAVASDLVQGVNQMPKINQNDFLSNFQQNTTRGQGPQTQTSDSQNLGANARDQQKNQSAQGIERNQTPNQQMQLQSQVFIPPNKKAQDQQQQNPQNLNMNQPTTQNLGVPGLQGAELKPASSAGLNVASAIFTKAPPKVQTPISQPIQASVPQQVLPASLQSALAAPNNATLSTQSSFMRTMAQGNANLGTSGGFRPPVPGSMRSPAPFNQQANQQMLQMQAGIEQKLQKAIQENAKIRLEDIIEDSNMPGPNNDGQESIKFICNNTGKNNFQAKLEELKQIIVQNVPVNLNWFIHYILIKRISSQSQNLHQIYIDLIKQLGQKEAVPLTITQAVDIFKKCLLVDEELLHKVAQRPQSQGSLVKAFLINLGTFLGSLTVANNRPLLAKELDIKQLLVEAFQTTNQAYQFNLSGSDKHLKYVVTFVCRIFKEASKSNIFKHSNPWIKANLEILREIHDWALKQSSIGNQQNEVLMEIDALCKCMGINNINEVSHSGFLSAAVNSNFQTSSQQVEIMHLQNKVQLLPAVQPPIQQQPPQIQGFQRPPNMSPLPTGSLSGFGIFQPQAPPGSIATPGSQDFLGGSGGMQSSASSQAMLLHTQAQIISKVVVSQEILSVICGPNQRNQAAREQLMRKIVSEAVDASIVEILPPVVDRSVTIALITTRELVLKDFAFDGNYNSILNAADLIVQNLAGSLALVTCREPLKMSLTTNLKRSLSQQLNQTLQQDGEPQLSESQIQELAQHASRENLELGCKLIKKSVIQKALTKVREDPQILRAIESRKTAKQMGMPHYQDETLISQFQDLPAYLKPNPSGLTPAQFQVYEDFGRMNAGTLTKKGEDGITKSLSGEGAASNYNIESLLKQFERQQLIDDVLEYQLGQKLQQLTTQAAASTAADQSLDPTAAQQLKDEQAKLWTYCQKWFYTVCEKYNQAGANEEQIQGLIEGLSFIARKYKAEDYQKKLTQQFLSFDPNIVQNSELTLTLIQKSIFSISHWDSSMALFLRDTQQFQLQEQLFTFLKDLLEQGIQKQKVFGYHQIPNLMAVLEKISENPYIGKFFQAILEDMKHKTTWNKDTLSEYFNEWAVISFEESYPKQEQEVNRFFNNLQQMGLYKDPEIMYNFCKVMVELSIERALFTADGQKRPVDRLVYRYIESFLKLMIVLLKTSDINKHEFMSKLFEVIHEVLDEDHKTKRADFNQKPYYRLLINILTAVNNSQFFNPKTHLLILFSLADLFNKLNPIKYAAFSFAWLELISHKQFMPHFLQASPPPLNAPQQNPAAAGAQQQNRKGQAAQAQTQQQLQQQQQDNTFYQKWFKFKELIVNLFTFLKSNMLVGQKLSEPLVKFYEATLRTVLVIRHDYPEFLCDFHFNFVNSLPDHCIQLKNIILSAQPRSIPLYNPFSKNLKVDTLLEISSKPRMSSNYDNYLSLMNLREDLEKYFRTKNQGLIKVICDKMMQSEEIINGRRKINSSIINAVALFIGNFALQSKNQSVNQKECYEMLKKILLNLNPETRLCLLNSLVNELRYINSYTYFYSWIVIFLFSDNDESLQEQITRILIERLQTHDPHPWGLCITFRELLQNPKYQFAKKGFVVRNQPVIEQLLQTRLQPFYTFWQNQRQALGVNSQQQQQPNQQDNQQ